MTVLKEGAAMAQMGWVMGVMTIAFMIGMSAWVLWAWWPGNRESMEQAALLPLEED